MNIEQKCIAEQKIHCVVSVSYLIVYVVIVVVVVVVV